MPLIRDYNSDSNIYGLKGHSTFMSVCKFRSFTKRNLRSSHADSFSRSCFFLPDLRRRSIVPTDHFLGKNPNVLAFGIIENGYSWLFSTKMGVAWPFIFNQRHIHLTTHMFSCHRSHSWIYGGDQFLVKNP
jgi:hypothetical protein